MIKWFLNHIFAKLSRLSSKSFTKQDTSNFFIILTALPWIISSFQCPSWSTPIWNQHSSLFQNNAKYGDNVTRILQLLDVWSLLAKAKQYESSFNWRLLFLCVFILSRYKILFGYAEKYSVPDSDQLMNLSCLYQSPSVYFIHFSTCLLPLTYVLKVLNVFHW